MSSAGERICLPATACFSPRLDHILRHDRALSAPLPVAPRLLLAARKGDGLVYVGGCGTGWSNKESVQHREPLDAIPASQPPVALKHKGAIFAEPLLIAEVEYRAWTQDWRLRHPSFKGVREMGGSQDIHELREQ